MPEIGNVLFITTACIGLVFLRPTPSVSFWQPLVSWPIISALILTFAYGISTMALEGALGVGYIAAVLTIPVLAIIAQKAEGWPPLPIAGFALAGAFGAAAVAIIDLVIFKSVRAGGIVANPIHFADVALIAGCLSLIGLMFETGWKRYVFLLGPFFSIAAIILSGTRGTIVALVLMIGLGLVLSAWWRVISMRRLLWTISAALLVFIIAWVLGLNQLSGIARVMHDMAKILQFELPADSSTSVRLQMYQGAFNAFMASPIVGVGPFAFTEVANALSPEPFGSTPHLHNDIANFAASGGILGLISYFLILLAPVRAVFLLPASNAQRKLAVITITAVFGFFVMGLTNAMFGILNLTVYFSAMAVAIGGIAVAIKNGRVS